MRKKQTGGGARRELVEDPEVEREANSGRSEKRKANW